MALKTAEDKIIAARIQMLLNWAFFGSLATRLKMVDATAWMPTMGTDGRHLYFNRDFVMTLDKPELVFVVGHEVLHCVYDHMTRVNSRDKQLWNAAADFVINLELQQQELGKVPTKVGVLLDKRFENMYTEQVYELLQQESKSKSMSKAMKDMLEKGNFDVHIDPQPGEGDGDEEGEGGGKGKPDPTGKNGPVPLTEADKEQIKQEVRDALIQASKNSNGAGKMPAGVKRIIDDLTEPVTDWRALLNAQIQSVLRDDFTFMRQSRKSMSMRGIYLPGLKNDLRVEVDVAIDTSGSIGGQMLKDFLGEVKGIMEQFRDFSLRVYFFDTQLYEAGVREFTPENVNEIYSIEPKGGGGTMFECVFDWLKENDRVPNRLIIMTDGCPCATWGSDNYCDTVFLVHGNPKIVAPYGITIHYAEDEKK